MVSLFALLLIAFSLSSVLAHPLCLDLSTPRNIGNPLSFCDDPSYSTYGCCGSSEDDVIAASFKALNVSNSACSSFLKQIYCAQCDPYSAHLFGVESSPSKLHSISSGTFYPPFLCSQATPPSSVPYCTDFYSACADVPVFSSPFEPKTNTSSVQTSTILRSYFDSASSFCQGFALDASGVLSSSDACFSGTPYGTNSTNLQSESTVQSEGICVEKISKGFVTTLVDHPDGSGRAFVGVKSGKVYLVNLGDSGNLTMNDTEPFLDLTSLVNSYGDMGLVGLAFHPNFKSNGRFFVSYHCDSKTDPNKCGVSDFPCPCSESLPCSESNGTVIKSCRNATVVAEYLAQGTDYLAARKAIPTENKRILTYGLPFDRYRGGQIQFGPIDTNLYIQLGDGSTGQYNVSQNLNVLLGKILRVDVNDESLGSSTKSTVYGKYNVPKRNPFYSEWKGGNGRGEIFAFGFKNPSCSFDKLEPTYFFCSDLASDGSGIVQLVKSGGNYGWGSILPSKSVQNPIILVNSSWLQSPIVGGYVSRSTVDSCLYGKYLFNDYGSHFFTGTESPKHSGIFNSSEIPLKCAPSSPTPCSPYLATGAQVFRSWAEMNDGNLYLLASNGIFRVVSSTNCGFLCGENTPPPPPLSPNSPPPVSSSPPPESGEKKEEKLSSGEYWLRAGTVLGLIVFWSLFVICGCCTLGYFRYNKKDTSGHQPFNEVKSESDYESDGDEPSRRVYF